MILGHWVNFLNCVSQTSFEVSGVSNDNHLAGMWTRLMVPTDVVDVSVKKHELSYIVRSRNARGQGISRSS